MSEDFGTQSIAESLLGKCCNNFVRTMNELKAMPLAARHKKYTMCIKKF